MHCQKPPLDLNKPVALFVVLRQTDCSLLSGTTEQADQRSKEPNQNHHHRYHRHQRS